MRTGDIILVHNYWKPLKIFSYLSAAIRYFTKSYWNHAAIVYVDEEEQKTWVFEANQHGVIKSRLSDWRRKPRDFVVLRWKNPVNEYVMGKRILHYEGYKYDFWNTLVYQLIFRVFGKWYGPTGKASDKTLNCSEYVGKVYVGMFKHAYRLVSADIWNRRKEFELVEYKYKNTVLCLT